MKTTLDIPDELMRAAKIRAATEDRKLKDVVADLIRRGLAEEQPLNTRIRRRVRFPLIEGTRPARPGEEATPERLAAILEAQDVESMRQSS